MTLVDCLPPISRRCGLLEESGRESSNGESGHRPTAAPKQTRLLLSGAFFRISPSRPP
jgi:hypothetical protein